MRTRRILAIVLAFVTLPFLLFGLIDALEGGISLLVAIVLGVIIWAVARVPVPKLLWISLIATMALGADDRHRHHPGGGDGYRHRSQPDTSSVRIRLAEAHRRAPRPDRRGRVRRAALPVAVRAAQHH